MSDEAGGTSGELARSVSWWMFTLYGVGSIVGAGIYALVGEVAGRAGMFAPLSFVGAAVLAGCTALSLGELASRMPWSAGEAVYVQEAFGRRVLSTLTGLGVMATGVVSAATLARAFAGYLGGVAPVSAPWAIAGFVLVLGAVAAWGIRQSLWLNAVATVVEVLGLLLVVWASRGYLGDWQVRLGDLEAWSGEMGWGVAMGAFVAFYAFIGFEDMVNLAEEVRNPRRVIPVGIVLALSTATALYAVVSITAVLVVPADELAASRAPLALVYERATGGASPVIGVVALFAVTNGALAQIVMAPRVLYGMARRGWLPPVFGRVNPRTHTPLPATAFVTATVLALALIFPLVQLAEATTIIILMVFTAVNLALVAIKRRDPRPPGVRTFPNWIPVAGGIVSLGFLTLRLVGPLLR